MIDIRDTLIAIFHRLLQYMPHLSIAAVIAVSITLVSLGKVVLLLKASIILVPLIIVSIFIIIYKKQIQKSITSKGIDSLLFHWKEKRLEKIYITLFAVTYIGTILRQEFDIAFILLIAILYLITVLQIFNKHEKSNIILAELILTSLLLSFTSIFAYPYSYPICDIMVHTRWIDAILYSGNLLPAEIYGQYTSFPLYHILIALAALVSNTGSYTSAYICHIPFAIICTIFVYYITKNLTKSKTIAELSAFFYLMIPSILHYTITIMPNIHAICAFIIILYIYFVDDNKISESVRLILTVISVIYLTLVHHMTIPLVFFFMGIIILSSWLYKYPFSKTQKVLVILLYSIPLLYWMYTFFTTGVSSLLSRLLTPTESGMVNVFVGDTETFNFGFWMNNGISAILIVLLFAAIYHLAFRKNHFKREKLLILLPITTVMLIFFLPGIVDISYQLIQMLQVIRWRIILSPIFAILLAFGCVVLVTSIHTITNNKRCAQIIAIVFCLLCIIISPILGHGGETIPQDYATIDAHLSESDLALYSTIDATIPIGSGVTGDYATYRYYSENSAYTNYNQPYYIKELGLEDILSEWDTTVNPQYLVFKHTLFFNNHLHLKFAMGDGNSHVVPYNESWLMNLIYNMYGHNTYYENGDTTIYTR